MVAGEPACIRPSLGFPRLLGRSLKAHAIYFAYVAVYAGLGSLVMVRYEAVGFDFGSAFLSLFLLFMPVILLAIVALRFLHLVFHVRPKRPTLALIREVKTFVTDPARMAGGIAMTVAMLLFTQAFSSFKMSIPVVNPFSWDERFAALDAWLHFGRQPWEWLQPVIGYAPVTFAINVAYNLWFMEMWLVWVVFAFATMPSALRTRFFVSFMLVWSLGGTLLATVFSSAGPIFYPELGLDAAPYQGLIDYLYGVDDRISLWALSTKEVLWTTYLSRENVISGISAMPSMHNASALLFALAGMKLGRKVGIGLSVYAVLIFIGSIHLGWHYASDAYLGFALTLAAWWVAKPIASWYERQPWPSSYRAAIEGRQGAPAPTPEGALKPAV